MRITICGSMDFASEMLKIGEDLTTEGHVVSYPELTEKYAAGELSKQNNPHLKKELGLMRLHFKKIRSSDSILVVNGDKNGVRGRIGANTFIEIGIAFEHEKVIFLLEDAPSFDYISEELEAMYYISLKGDLANINFLEKCVN